MIELPATPGNNPWKSFQVGTDFDERTQFGHSAAVPVSQANFLDTGDVQNINNAGHDQYLVNLDPRTNFGKANPKNPNSSNYTNYNPTVGRQDLF